MSSQWHQRGAGQEPDESDMLKPCRGNLAVPQVQARRVWRMHMEDADICGSSNAAAQKRANDAGQRVLTVAPVLEQAPSLAHVMKKF